MIIYAALQLLKQSKCEEVSERIKRRLQLDLIDNGEKSEIKETLVEKCYKYLNNRKDCLDYQEALNKNLPIGSGHRHVIQKRLKIAGAWRKPETTEHMLNLRMLRANHNWEDDWRYQKKAA